MPRLSKIGAAALAAFGWTSGVSAVSASYLVVAGGGSGGRENFSSGTGGGGGAGGLRTGTLSLDPALSYTVTVGAGGAVSGSAGTVGANGSNSVFSTITSTGGGGGGGGTSNPASGATGGSGGGAAGTAGGTTFGTGTAGQGNNGGTGGGGGGGAAAGGGGGAGAVGGNATTTNGGAGGAGTASSISGSSITYAGGGGGASASAGVGGAGGAGGGGAGAQYTTGGATAGTANTGGGGGGGSNNPQPAGAGGSGIVIISYAGAQQFGGGVVTTDGTNTIHTFTTSGTLSPITPLSASYLVVAGGGGGSGGNGGSPAAGAGGGGAGGYRTATATIDPNSIYVVTVGAGGAGGADNGLGVNGSNSVFLSTTSTGGGRGGSTGGVNGATGGSGGGGQGKNSGAGGAGNTPSTSPSQGSNGGAGGTSVGGGGGGGGGASATGTTATSASGGAGGAGTASSLSGASVTYAGGGGGGNQSSGSGGTGGSGGGGAGGTNAAGTAATANTGGGGGGGGVTASNQGFVGGAGGSGVVIISYPGSTQQMAGGTVTITGGNVIHTFTSSGYLTPLKLVNNSLRFRSSASAYLNRTPATAGDRKTWTYSCWVKRGRLGADQALISAYTGTATINTQCSFMADDTLDFYDNNGSYVFRLTTTQVFRDPAAWYHIVLAVDTTQATSSNRVKIYVNGTQITSFSTATYPPLNDATGDWNSNTEQRIGRHATNYLDGYLAEINNIDGQALTPNSFGAFNSYGVWQPITYGGSYGTNGFYLPFKTNASSYVGSFNGSNQYLSIASNSVFNQSGDFTIEYYAYLNANTNYQVIVGRGTGFITIQHSSDANAMIRLVRYGQATIATGGNVTAGKWNHFAIVRSGSTVTGYLNGIAVVSGTDSTSTATGNALAIGQNSDGTNYFAGQISNVRYTNTAVYTSNFTPSTSALTAVSGTQLLTLQNSSIVDNSTNALSITNNNSVTTGQTYPFAYTIFNDQGPAGNNWTPTNVSGAFGSTLDYMTDVPTLTSATAANYAVLNPLSTLYTVTAGNLDFTYTNSTSGVWYLKGTSAVSSDKYYWEVTPTNVGAGLNISIGIILSTNTQTNTTTINLVTDGYVYHSDGNKYSGAGGTTGVAYGATYTNNDVIGVALDLTAGTLVFYKNNVSQGTAFTGLTSSYMLLICNHLGGTSRTVAGSVNAGQRPFTYTPPTGFVALNTYNL